MKIKGWFIIGILAFSFLATNYAFANEDLSQVKNPTIAPTSLFYPVKRLWEKGFSYVLVNKGSKANYNRELLKERLEELKYVAEKKYLSEIERSTQRFSYQAGVLVEDLKSLDDKNKNKIVLEDFEAYKKILDQLRNLYPANSSYWMLIQHSINTLTLLSDI